MTQANSNRTSVEFWGLRSTQLVGTSEKKYQQARTSFLTGVRLNKIPNTNRLNTINQYHENGPQIPQGMFDLEVET